MILRIILQWFSQNITSGYFSFRERNCPTEERRSRERQLHLLMWIAITVEDMNVLRITAMERYLYLLFCTVSIFVAFWYLNFVITIINYLILFIPKPAKQVISLDVEYAPEVEATEIFVHAATGNIHTQLYISLNRTVWWWIKRLPFLTLDISGNSVELVCNVHAHPTPIVKWFKNKMELTEDVAQVMPEKIDRGKLSANISASRFESLLKHS